jgi:hypothetical protein
MINLSHHHSERKLLGSEAQAQALKVFEKTVDLLRFGIVGQVPYARFTAMTVRGAML